MSSRVVEEIPTIGTDRGAKHSAFFQDPLKVHNQSIQTSRTRFLILEENGTLGASITRLMRVQFLEKTELSLKERLF